MSKIWFTSDTHFGHDRDFMFTARGLTNIEDHDELLFSLWNELVAPDDEVYHLGDVFLLNNEHGLDLLSKLNGKIHIIIGNHDTKTRVELFNQCSNVVEVTQVKELKVGKHYFWLCHYPTLTACEDGKPLSEHLICLHGHLHSGNKFLFPNNPYIYNVNPEAQGNRPVALDDILNDIRNKKEELTNEGSNNYN